MARVLLLALALILASARSACAVGFQTVSVPDAGHSPIFVGIWYPSGEAAKPLRIALDTLAVAAGGAIEGANLKLIVMSHGLGGGFADHIDTAFALAQAGFVVAAPTHTGDSLKDSTHLASIWDRTRQLHVVTDWVLRSWPGHTHLDRAHIGVFGFSAGGFTALVAAGGVPDLRLVDGHCAKFPAEFTCSLIDNAKPMPSVPPGAWVHDPRIKAAVIASPGLGFIFGKSGLSGVRIPLQLWRGTRDQTLPQPFYAQAVADNLPTPPDYHVVHNAQHLDFLSPCDASKARITPTTCASLPGFDRATFHASFNESIVAFYKKSLWDRQE